MKTKIIKWSKRFFMLVGIAFVVLSMGIIALNHYRQGLAKTIANNIELSYDTLSTQDLEDTDMSFWISCKNKTMVEDFLFRSGFAPAIGGESENHIIGGPPVPGQLLTARIEGEMVLWVNHEKFFILTFSPAETNLYCMLGRGYLIDIIRGQEVNVSSK